MAKLSKEEMQRIVDQQMPRYKVRVPGAAPVAADAGGAPTRATPEAETPDLKTLRKKYLRNKFLGTTDSGFDQTGEPNSQPATDAGADDDTEIVLVEPKTESHPLDRSSRPKAIVVSTTRKKIIGQQG